jgi:hypothetical protein
MLLRPFSAIDLAGWIAHGRYFLTHHEILRQDIFSVLPTRPLVYPAWGISILYALADRAGGFLAVCMLHVVALGVLLGILYWNSIARIQEAPNRVALLGICAFWLGSFQAFSDRPSEIALIPLALSYIWISEIKSPIDITPKLIFKLCILNVIWVNIHGSFVLLSLMLLWKVVFLLLSKRRENRDKLTVFRSGLAVAGVVASSLMNPFNYRVFPYLFETSKLSRVRLLEEWQATKPWGLFPVGRMFYALFAVMVVIAIRKLRREKSSVDFLAWFSSPFFLLLLDGFTAARNAMLPFVVLLPFMSEKGYLNGQPGSFKQWTQPHRIRLFATVPFLIVLILALPQFRTQVTSFFGASLPPVFEADVVPRIAKDIRDSGENCPVFNSWDVGSYLMLTVPNRIYIDSRNIIYDVEVYDSYQRALQGRPGWDQLLDRYQACFAVLNPMSEPGLIHAIEARKGWEFRDQENGYLLFARKYQ